MIENIKSHMPDQKFASPKAYEMTRSRFGIVLDLEWRTPSIEQGGGVTNNVQELEENRSCSSLLF